MDFGEAKSIQLLKQIVELEPIEFLGICKITGVDVVTTDTFTLEPVEECAEVKVAAIPRPFEDIWNDVCDKVDSLNRTQRRNLQKLVKAAIKKEK